MPTDGSFQKLYSTTSIAATSSTPQIEIVGMPAKRVAPPAVHVSRMR